MHLASGAVLEGCAGGGHHEELDRAFGRPSGCVSGLIFWPKGPEATAAEVVDQALAYRPFAR
ncbi:hypothetical protein BIV25_39220 [Streptomyces sp. MUSC 14]|nr:hypothetical protein BIV25_39220 [Streptomyces sp. MUSC 14]